jgi:hypothetical protein
MTAAPPRGPGTLGPTDLFDCARLHCRLSAGACVARQDACRQGNGYGDRVPAYPTCARGTCAQGMEIRARLPDGFTPRPFQERRGDLAAQARARNATARAQLSGPPTIDSPPPARREAANTDRSPQSAAPRPAATRRRKATAVRTCTKCGKQLRASSKGDLCYRCHVRAGHAVPGRPELTSIPGIASPLPASLPDPALLPVEYLVRCVVVAVRIRAVAVAMPPGIPEPFPVRADGLAPEPLRLPSAPQAATRRREESTR